MTAIFDENGEFTVETQCINIMPNALIQYNDGLPQTVCLNCLEKLQNCVNVIDGFVMNQNLFLS